MKLTDLRKKRQKEKIQTAWEFLRNEITRENVSVVIIQRSLKKKQQEEEPLSPP